MTLPYDMTNEPLKPCPFCGGEAVYTSRANPNQSGWQHDVDHWVYCDSDGLCSANQGMYESKTEAIAAWNTRADIHQAVVAERNALKAKVKELEAQGRSDRHVAMDASANELGHIGRIAALEEQLATARNHPRTQNKGD